MSRKVYFARTKAQRKEFEKRCCQLLNKWAKRLDLEGWEIDTHFAYDVDATEKEHSLDNLLTGGHIEVEPNYRRAIITYQVPNTEAWIGVEDSELNAMLLHELIHIILATFSDLVTLGRGKNQTSREHYIFVNEHTTSWLTAVIRRGYEPPKKT